MTAAGKREAARRRALGRAGEEAAADFLRARGLEIVARNYHTPFGELDVVARDGNTLVCAEVKTARAEASVDPRTQFTPRKVSRLYRAAQYYFEKEEPAAESDLRFDFLVVLRGEEGFDVEHYEAVPLHDYLPPDFDL